MNRYWIVLSLLLTVKSAIAQLNSELNYDDGTSAISDNFASYEEETIHAHKTVTNGDFLNFNSNSGFIPAYCSGPGSIAQVPEKWFTESRIVLKNVHLDFNSTYTLLLTSSIDVSLHSDWLEIFAISSQDIEDKQLITNTSRHREPYVACGVSSSGDGWINGITNNQELDQGLVRTEISTIRQIDSFLGMDFADPSLASQYQNILFYEYEITFKISYQYIESKEPPKYLVLKASNGIDTKIGRIEFMNGYSSFITSNSSDLPPRIHTNYACLGNDCEPGVSGSVIIPPNTEVNIEYCDEVELRVGFCAELESKLQIMSSQDCTSNILSRTVDNSLSYADISSEDTSSILITPNPSSGFVTIGADSRSALLYVFNSQGIQMFSGHFDSTDNEYDFSYLDKGIYIVTLISNEQTVSGKLIIH
ncbi:T9SS type A sorting domain-containing protein [Aquimarina pacifica]|uniref:T9SS type A sorting domain-containing protein n=1 Tax=Aquimarina pacifica TaxID=1296415 RepID=UPI0004B69A22|nr:T9SS type A sorting domain-containing protein [Aquimarina pacifica]